MSTNENSSETNSESVDQNDNLDLFSADFFGQKESTSAEANAEEDVGSADETPHEEDTHTEDDDTLDTEDELEEEEAHKPEPKKKNRFQERIDEVVGKQREAERKLEDALAELERLKNPQKQENKPTQEVKSEDGPSPDDKNEDGTDKYPLGEFDKNYIRDVINHAYDQKMVAAQAEAEAKARQQAQQAEMDAAKAALQTEWQGKLGPAQERYPDFQEKGEELIANFTDLDEAYGEYLSATIMSMEYGPDVLYYLASNPEEAKKIVNSGPQKASIALGRLEARFLDAEEKKQQARPKVSNAPPPPPTNKGHAAAQPRVAPDTDDLDAFARELFKGR